jgi:hypothetical protein
VSGVEWKMWPDMGGLQAIGLRRKQLTAYRYIMLQYDIYIYIYVYIFNRLDNVIFAYV